MKKKYCISKFCLGPNQWAVAIWEFDSQSGKYVQHYFKILATDQLAEAWIAGASHGFMVTNPGDWWTHIGFDPNSGN